jgi:cytidylate kinase
MAKIMGVMANFLRATMAKACRSFWPHMEAVVKAGRDFSSKVIPHIPVNNP